MIPFDLIIASSSRPSCLRPTLETLFANLDQMPARVILHEDIRDGAKAEEVIRLAREITPADVPLVVQTNAPPIFHGPSLQRLCDEAATDFVLYTQDDWATLRPLPIARALALMEEHGLHHIRFNKRGTMGEHGATHWRKREVWFGDNVLTLAPAWNFQTALWRRARMKAALDWWQTTRPGSIAEWCEVKLNEALNGVHAGFNALGKIDVPAPGRHLDQDERVAHSRTYIWGPIGEPQFIQHLGNSPEKWAMIRPNRTLT